MSARPTAEQAALERKLAAHRVLLRLIVGTPRAPGLLGPSARARLRRLLKAEHRRASAEVPSGHWLGVESLESQYAGVLRDLPRLAAIVETRPGAVIFNDDLASDLERSALGGSHYVKSYRL